MYYGAMHKIEQQLNEEGLTLGKYAEMTEKIHFGLNASYMHGILPDREYEKALNRLNKFVISKAEKLKEN